MDVYTELKPGDVAPFDKDALMWSGFRYLSEAKIITLTDGSKVACKVSFGSLIPGTDGKGGTYTVYGKEKFEPKIFYKKNNTSGGNKRRIRRRKTRRNTRRSTRQK
jgi:hypothetical protein